MKCEATRIKDVLLLEPEVFSDVRGYFLESYRESWLPEVVFVQDNQSSSVKNTLRGIHYQRNFPQGKLIQVLLGEVLDVAVDLRRSSSTFGKWTSTILSSENHHLFWVPPGFGHGFAVLSERAVFHYKCTNYYDPEDQHIIRWDDPDLNIDWQVKNPILSERDENGKDFRDAQCFS